MAKTDFGEVFLKDYQAEITKIQTFFGGKIRKDLVAVLMLVSCMIGITPTSPIVYSVIHIIAFIFIIFIIFSEFHQIKYIKKYIKNI